MDTNPMHDANYQPQDRMRRVGRDAEHRPHSPQPQTSAAAYKSVDKWSTIREMARDFGVSIRALRFYEDRGLLHPRREGTARRYNARDRLCLKMILKGKQLGFTLSEIHDILAARAIAGGEGEGRRAATQDLTTSDLSDADFEQMDLEMRLPPEQIVAQISHLERQRRDLDEAIIALRDAHRRLLKSPCRAAI